MKKLIRWFHGYVYISLTGRQVNRFLNLCSRNDIHIWNITQDLERFIRGHIRLKDFFYLKPFLRKTKTHLRIIGKHGYPFWCYRHPHLKWFPAFILAFACIIVYSNTLIWNIQIQGNEKVSEQELLQFLAEQKIEVGQKISEVDCSQIEYTIRQNYSELGWVSVYVDQTKLCIDVRESLYDEYPFDTDEAQRYDFIANKDAYIYSMITRTGKAVVSEGMHVKKGETLVEGTCDILNDNGEVIEILYKKADALIIGQVEYTYYGIINEMELAALQITGLYTDDMLSSIGYEKINPYIEKLEENGVIILDKSVMIEKKENSIIICGKIICREEVGINIPVEEVTENEFE